MLLSAGGFAIYLAESNVFNLLVPRFGDPGIEANRRRLLEVWLRTKLFRAGHIDAAPLEQRLKAGCHAAGDFLRIFMEEICRTQGATRWADNSPEEMLYMPAIKQAFPNALFIHIIRDGRDVAASLNQQGWIRPLPGDSQLMASGLYWQWIVRKGRQYGKALGGDYFEQQFEDLVARPQQALGELGRFLEHSLDYGRIQRAGIGSVGQPNTSFPQETKKTDFNPVGRWRKTFCPSELSQFEEFVGPFLEELGYELAYPLPKNSARAGLKRWLYQRYFEGKIWMKNTWLYRAYYRSLKVSENVSRINYIVMADDVTRPLIPAGVSSEPR
jgi:Sulfotransferase family